jgi:hypothetical protein
LNLFQVFPAILKKNPTEDKKDMYETNLDAVFEYIKSRLDILEHKFLVFLCNMDRNHWVSVVVINPFVVLEANQQTGTTFDYNQCQDDDQIAGWCIFNSNVSGKDKNEHGFQGTESTKNKASFGVQLFLNICASYIKFKKDHEGIGQGSDELDNFAYQEPFGS